MHAFVRKSLLLSAAAGAVVLGCATAATAAVSATADGSTSNNSGLVAGDTVPVSADVPIQVCGISAALLATGSDAVGNSCVNDATAATAMGSSAGASGVASGNVVEVAADAPIQACGDTVALLGFGDAAQNNSCVNGTSATPAGSPVTPVTPVTPSPAPCPPPAPPVSPPSVMPPPPVSPAPAPAPTPQPTPCPLLPGI